MDWVQIISALALVMFIVVLFPATRYMMKNSPKGTSSDWISFVIPLVVIVLFILLLVKLV
jgi:TRAP-type C4-dicarboxylate transport system permease small subunit